MFFDDAKRAAMLGGFSRAITLPRRAARSYLHKPGLDWPHFAAYGLPLGNRLYYLDLYDE
jgi:hypothetical protein